MDDANDTSSYALCRELIDEHGNLVGFKTNTHLLRHNAISEGTKPSISEGSGLASPRHAQGKHVEGSSEPLRCMHYLSRVQPGSVLQTTMTENVDTNSKLMRLPEELLIHLSKYLDEKTTHALTRVCHTFRHVFVSNLKNMTFPGRARSSLVSSPTYM